MSNKYSTKLLKKSGPICAGIILYISLVSISFGESSAFGTSYNFTSQLPNGSQIFKDPYAGFQIEFPKESQSEYSGHTLPTKLSISKFPNSSSGTVNVVVEQLSPSIDIAQYASMMTDRIGSSSMIVKWNPANLSGIPAHMVEYIPGYGHSGIKVKQISAIMDDKGYTMSYANNDQNYSKYMKEFDNMVKSFKFVSENLIPYNNPMTGFSLSYPSFWSVNEENSSLNGENYTSTIFSSPEERVKDRFIENVRVDVIGSSNDSGVSSLEELISFYADNILDQTSTPMEHISFGNNTGTKLSFNTQISGDLDELINIRVLVIHLPINDKIYAIIAEVENDKLSYYEPLLASIIDSFSPLSQ